MDEPYQPGYPSALFGDGIPSFDKPMIQSKDIRPPLGNDFLQVFRSEVEATDRAEV